MRTSRALEGGLWATLIVCAVFVQACSGPWLRVRQVPEDGYTQTLHYQFQAQVHGDARGQCKRMVVRVRSLSTSFAREEPPPRLQLFDDDCISPIRFERVQYISRQTGEHVRLAGPDVVRFLSDHVGLEDELIGWLWREGVI